MNDITQAFVPLRDEDIAAAQALGRETVADEWSTISPIPDNACPFGINLWGNSPDATWTYRDMEGRALGVECRWLVNGEKEIRFATLCRHIDGREAWRLKHLPAPRPIFGLDRLAAKPDAPVLVVEGPKKCEPAERTFPDYVAIAWPAGANSVHLVDWSPLKNRRVLIWPDNDDTGREAAARIADCVRAAGAASAFVVPVPVDFPIKWDLADPPPTGADLDGLLAAAVRLTLPCPSAAGSEDSRHPAFVSWGQFTMDASGLTMKTVRGKGDTKEESEVLVSSAFELLGHARDPNGRGWGRWLRWRDADDRIHSRHIADAALQGDSASLCAMLADEGLHVVRGQQKALCEYLNGGKVDERVMVVHCTGWHDIGGARVFVLPDEVIGHSSAEHVMFEGGSNSSFETGGTLEGWQKGVGEAVRGHVLPILAISTALAGPLLALLEQEGGGVNFYGASSRGKTTMAQAAASVWGRGASPGFVRAWRATANGLEGVAAITTDTVLILDELGVVEARDASAAIYSLANGTGKSRAARDGSLRNPKTWRTLILSTGELAIEGKLAEDKGRRAKAGQLVRMLDIPADRGKGFGAFDHGGPHDDASNIADQIKKEAVTNFGLAGPTFVKRLLAQDLNTVARHLRVVVDEFVRTKVPPGADGQVIRAAQRLGLIGAAGEEARSYGVCPWDEGDAFRAATWALARWIENRGGTEAAETRQAVERVRRFMEAHGESRFESLEDDARPPVQNRAGWRTGKGAEREWLVPPETWKLEICLGCDPVNVARVLAERGMLRRISDGLAAVRKIHGQNQRVYVLTSAILASVDSDA